MIYILFNKLLVTGALGENLLKFMGNGIQKQFLFFPVFFKKKTGKNKSDQIYLDEIFCVAC